MTFKGAFKNLLAENTTNLVANQLKKGDKIKNINPDCQHCGNEGKVVKTIKHKGKGGISGKTVIYKTIYKLDKFDNNHSKKLIRKNKKNNIIATFKR